MSETERQEPINLDSLGEHVGLSLIAHHERHEQDHERHELAKTRLQREQRLSELHGRLNSIIEGEEIEPTTMPHEIQTLDTGTKVAAIVTTYANDSVRGAARKLVSGEPHGLGERYLDEGPISRTAIAGETFSVSSPAAEKLLRGSLVISLTLETPHETGDSEPTHDTTYVGAILDPESILIGEETRIENGDQRYLYGRVIGPDDNRFGPVMDVLSRVNQDIGAGGESPQPASQQ